MNILLCGSSGFIGRNIAKALITSGHRVTGTHSPGSPRRADTIAVDFTRDTDPAVWLPRLNGIDAVINAVGVLRDTPQRPIQALHTDTPRALFDACAEAGVRRAVLVSALGIEGSAVPYATTKLAAERHLLGLRSQGRLDAVVLRPSIVFGPQGASSKLFMGLAHSPLLMLPQRMFTARIQPVAVADLAQAVANLMVAVTPWPDAPLPCVGPTALTMAGFIASLRAQLGHTPARAVPLPAWMTMLSARVGDHIPALPFCSDTLALLAQDNVAPAEPFAAVLGRTPISHQDLVKTSWQ